ncbi:hypothetical protein [Nocardia stercoris]|uniref:Uncharacterized protein n=1 Tax=Nocardia stercoris TaxID=2483361 RepID=A0A3M2L6H9_9NOCA|nr:hypothetical protein [Nocardia stercoris]RMI33259.1 hypothetical protein EBN03_08725 [Nocardia stercoris]
MTENNEPARSPEPHPAPTEPQPAPTEPLTAGTAPVTGDAATPVAGAEAFATGTNPATSDSATPTASTESLATGTAPTSADPAPHATGAAPGTAAAPATGTAPAAPAPGPVPPPAAPAPGPVPPPAAPAPGFLATRQQRTVAGVVGALVAAVLIGGVGFGAGVVVGHHDGHDRYGPMAAHDHRFGGPDFGGRWDDDRGGMIWRGGPNQGPHLRMPMPDDTAPAAPTPGTSSPAPTR